MATRTYFFAARGKGSFPFELLWRCECWPATLEDSYKINYACPTQAPELTIAFGTHNHLSGNVLELWRGKNWPVEWSDSIS